MAINQNRNDPLQSSSFKCSEPEFTLIKSKILWSQGVTAELVKEIWLLN